MHLIILIANGHADCWYLINLPTRGTGHRAGILIDQNEMARLSLLSLQNVNESTRGARHLDRRAVNYPNFGLGLINWEI